MSTVQVTLGDICTDGGIQTGPFGSQLHQSDYSREGIPVIMPVNLVDGAIDARNIARIEAHHVERLSKYVVHSGDIVYARRGDVGRCARVTKNEDGWLCGTGCLRLTTNGAHVNKDYIYYCLTQPSVVGWVQNHAVGATMPNLNTTILKSVPLVIEASIINQEHIANILSAYDNLIENNRKQIKLLEEEAQRLYKEWFIDLKFPNHETTPIDPTTNLPEGWKWCQIKDTCTRIQSGSTPSRKNTHYWTGKDFAWFKTKELCDEWLLNSEEYISLDALERTAVKLFPANTILMAIYASPTLGRLGILEKAGTFNQAALGLLADNHVASKEWLFLKLFELRNEFNSIARGAGQQNISGEIVKNYHVAVPQPQLIHAFSHLVEPLFDRIKCLQKCYAEAQEARDRLLPKLMSGEIEV